MRVGIQHSTTIDLKVSGGPALPKSHQGAFALTTTRVAAGASFQLTSHKNITAISRAMPMPTVLDRRFA